MLVKSRYVGTLLDLLLRAEEGHPPFMLPRLRQLGLSGSRTFDGHKDSTGTIQMQLFDLLEARPHLLIQIDEASQSIFSLPEWSELHAMSRGRLSRLNPDTVVDWC